MIISIYFLGNGDAGWKFWKKDKETTTTTTTPVSIDVQSIATPTSDPAGSKVTTVRGSTARSTINTGAAVIGAANPGLAVGASTTRENIRNNARPNRPNPGTEVGLDIIVPRPNRPGIGGNGQNYRDWAVDLTGAGEPSRNQSPRLPAQGPSINSDGQVQPNLSSTSCLWIISYFPQLNVIYVYTEYLIYVALFREHLEIFS